MYLLVFGMFIGMIVTMILIGIFSISKKDNNNDDNDKGNDTNDTNASERNTDVDISSNNCSRGYRCGDYNVYREPRTEEIIEDLIIFDMLGLL